jgi:hypothetical protein
MLRCIRLDLLSTRRAGDKSHAVSDQKLLAQSQQSKQGNYKCAEINLQCAIPQDIYTTHIPVDTTEFVYKC